HEGLRSFPTRRSSDLQLQGHRTAADHTAFVFQDQTACPLRPNLQHLDRQTILEIDLCRLRRGMATETRAAVMGMPLEIKAVAEGDRKSTRLNSSHVKI